MLKMWVASKSLVNVHRYTSKNRFLSTSSSTNNSSPTRMKAVFSWGVGTDGQLGHAKFNLTSSDSLFGFGFDKPVYEQIEPRRMLQSRKYDTLSLGKTFTLGLTKDGEIFGWGLDFIPKKQSNEPVAIPISSKIVKISSGSRHSAAIDVNGQIWTWGEGGSMFTGGKLGHGSNNPENAPKLIESFKQSGAKAAQVSCGKDHTLILTEDGEVLACGTCDFGLLGTGSSIDAKTPIPIEALADEKIIQVAAGKNHSAVLSKQGRVYTWGRASQGQLGHGDSMQDVYSMEDYPRVIEQESFDNKPIITIATMVEKSAAVTSDGKLYMWGTRFGQNPSLIHPSAFNDKKVVNVVIGGDSNKDVIAAVTEDSSLWIFGYADSKMLGVPNVSGWNILPIKVPFTVQNPVVLDIFAGYGQHIAAIVEFDVK